MYVKQVIAFLAAFSVTLSSSVGAMAMVNEHLADKPVIETTKVTGQSIRKADVSSLSYESVYEKMISLKETYTEGTPWTNFTPYGRDATDPSKKNGYTWKGGPVKGANMGVGCAAFVFILSDAAFDTLPARVIDNGNFQFDDVKVGDILRVNNSHFVIVLQKSAGGVTVAEGNYNKSVHWGRAISKAEVENANFIVTRYPANFIPPTEDDTKEVEGTMANGVGWSLTKSGTLTISGSGAIPDYEDLTSVPWNEYNDKISTIIIGDGITSIGNNAFNQSNALSVYIPDGVTKIGDNAFNNSGLIAVTIPKTVASIGNSAFRSCANLTSVSITEGLKTIGDSAFRSCAILAYIDFPSSIEKIGAGAFTGCNKMTQVRFMPGTKTVDIGDNLFSQCQYLTSVTIPKTANRISSGMFASCTLLSELYIPETITEIAIDALQGCSNLKTIYFGGTEDKWKSLTSSPYIKPTLQGKEIICNSEFTDPFAKDPNDPGDLPNIPGDVPVQDDVNTGIYGDTNYSSLASVSARTLFAYGGNVKQDDGSKFNYKTRTYYTNLQASNIVTTDKNGKTKTKKGKLVAGVTSTNTKPSLEKGKISKDAVASKIAKVSISKGKVKVTALKESGVVYVWAIDTGDVGACVCAKFVVNAAPTKLQVFANASSDAAFSADKKNVYKKDVVEIGNSVKIYVYPTYTQNKQAKETKDASYSASVNTQAASYFTVTQDESNPYCFVVKATGLKNNKKTSGKITIKCNENGRKTVFTATAVNGIQSILFDSVSGMTLDATSGEAITSYVIERSDTDKKTGSFVISTSKSSNNFDTTDKVKLYAMSKADGFDKAMMENGKVKITSKPSGNQKKLTAKIGSDKKTVTVTAAKKVSAQTSVYYLVFYNNKQGKGYNVVKITTK